MIKSFFIRMKTQKYKHCFKQMQPWIMGRTACLGNDLLKRLDFNMRVCNVQKGRVDYLLQGWFDNKVRVRAKEVEPYIIRDDIKNLIIQEQVLYSPLLSKPKLIFMDSFAELTDQMFQCNEKYWNFCANYSDIEHSDEFKNEFACKGLLPLEEIEDKLDDFAARINDMFGEIPIIYLHFPITLDSREKFKKRGRKILLAAENIAEKYSNFHSLAIDESIVAFAKDDDVQFPYHYCDQVYDTFTKLIRSRLGEINYLKGL